MKLKVLACTVAILCFLSSSIINANAVPAGNVSLEGAGVVVYLEFPEEAHPTETLTLNLTITAQTGLKLQNFTLVIEVLIDTGWQQVYREQVLSLNMVQNGVLERTVWFTLPQNAHEALRCDVYVVTDKAPGLPPNYIFYITSVRTMTYNDLLVNYSRLLADYELQLNRYNALSLKYDGLDSTYNSLNNEYNSLLNQHKSLQATFQSLNSSYLAQEATLDASEDNYDSLEANYKALNQTYYAIMDDSDSLRNAVDKRDNELVNTRYLMYVLIVVAVALLALVVYLKKGKSDPYVVFRKETVALKPT